MFFGGVREFFFFFPFFIGEGRNIGGERIFFGFN